MNKSLLAVSSVLAAVMTFIGCAQCHTYLANARDGQEYATQLVIANVYESRMNAELADILRIDPDDGDAAANIERQGFAFTDNLAQLAPLITRDGATPLAAIQHAWGACARAYTEALRGAGIGAAARTRAVAGAKGCFLDVNTRFAGFLGTELERTANQDAAVRDRLATLIPAVIVPSILVSISANALILGATAALFPLVAIVWTALAVRRRKLMPHADVAAVPRAVPAALVAVTPVVPIVSVLPPIPPHVDGEHHDEYSPEFVDSVHRIVDDIKHFHSIGSDLRALVEAAVPDITHLIHSIHHVRGNISAAQKVAEAAMLAVSMGEDTLREGLAGTAGSVWETMNSIHDRVQDLQARAAEVAAIVRLLSEISEQTHLLALKTAVKATNAGDAGKGLAIVSGAVVKLTDQGAEQARAALEMVSHIRSEAANVVHDLEASSAAAKLNSDTAFQTANTLGSIRTDMRALASHLQGVTTSSDTEPEVALIETEVEKMRDTLGTMMTSLAAISESTNEIADALYESLSEQGAVDEVGQR